MKIGIFGGTFNPPHVGHLIVAEHVRSELALDKILFIPSFISPHKQEGEEILSEHRLSMTQLAIVDNQYFECNGIEISRNEISYTVNTLEIIHQQSPDDKLYLLIGMDNYLTFHQWKEPHKVLELATLIVMTRPKFPKQVNEIIGTKNVLFVDVPNIDISSSDIRRRVKENRLIHYLVPNSVEKYILSNGLFR